MANGRLSFLQPGGRPPGRRASRSLGFLDSAPIGEVSPGRPSPISRRKDFLENRPQVEPDTPTWGLGRWVAAFTPILGGVLDIWDMAQDEDTLWEQFRDHTALTTLRIGANFLDFLPLWGFKGAITALRQSTGFTRAEAWLEIARHLAIGGPKYKSKLTRAYLKAERKKTKAQSLFDKLVAPGGSDVSAILAAPAIEQDRKLVKVLMKEAGEKRKYKEIDEMRELYENPFWMQTPDGNFKWIKFWMADEEPAIAVLRKTDEGWLVWLELGSGGKFKLSGGLHGTERQAKEFIAWLPGSKAAQDEVLAQTVKSATAGDAFRGGGNRGLIFDEVTEKVFQEVRLERKALREGRRLEVAPIEDLGLKGAPTEFQMYPDALSLEQAELLWKALRQSDDDWGIQDMALFEVLFSTGMRAEELLGLRWSDLKPQVPGEGVGPGIIEYSIAKKNTFERGSAVLRERAASALSILRKKRGELLTLPGSEVEQGVLDGMLAKTLADDHSLIFTNQRGVQMDRQTLQKRIDKYVKKAIEMGGKELEGARVTAHTFRRTFATMLHKAGATTDEIKYLLHHSPETKTEMYIRLATGGMKLNDENQRVLSKRLLESLDDPMVSQEEIEKLADLFHGKFWQTEEGRMAWVSAADTVLRGGRALGSRMRGTEYLEGTITEPYKKVTKKQQDAYIRQLALEIEDQVRLRPDLHLQGYKPDHGPVWYTDAEMSRLYRSIEGMTLSPKKNHDPALFLQRQNEFELDKLRDIAIIKMVHGAGFRPGSIIGQSPGKSKAMWHTGLRMRDVNWETGEVIVRQKGGGLLKVELEPDALFALQNYRKAVSKANLGLKTDPNAAVFIHHATRGQAKLGDMVKRPGFAKRLGQYGDTAEEFSFRGPGGQDAVLGKPAGIWPDMKGKVRFGTLRHTFATNLTEKYAHLPKRVADTIIGQRLGHVKGMREGLSATRRYIGRTAETAELRREYYVAKQKVFARHRTAQALWEDEIDKFIDWTPYGKYEDFVKDRFFIPERYIILEEIIEAERQFAKGVKPGDINLKHVAVTADGRMIVKSKHVSLADAQKIHNPDAHAEIRRFIRLDQETQLRQLKESDLLENTVLPQRADEFGHRVGYDGGIAPERRYFNKETVSHYNRQFTDALDKAWPNATRLVRRMLVGMRLHTKHWDADMADVDGTFADMLEVVDGELVLKKGIFQDGNGRTSTFMGNPQTVEHVDGQTDWGGTAMDRWQTSIDELDAEELKLEALKKLRYTMRRNRDKGDFKSQPHPETGKMQSLKQIEMEAEKVKKKVDGLRLEAAQRKQEVPISDGEELIHGSSASDRQKRITRQDETEFAEAMGGNDNPAEFYNEGVIYRLLIRSPRALETPPTRAKWQKAEDGTSFLDEATYLEDTGLDDAYEIVIFATKKPEIRKYKPEFKTELQAVGQFAHPKNFEAQSTKFYVGGEKFSVMLAEIDMDPAFKAMQGRWEEAGEVLTVEGLRKSISKKVIDARAMASMRGTSVHFEYMFREAQEIASRYGRKEAKGFEPASADFVINQEGLLGHQTFLDRYGYINPDIVEKLGSKLRPEDAWILQFTLEKLQKKYGVFSFGRAADREYRAMAFERWGHRVVDDVPFWVDREVMTEFAYEELSVFLRTLKEKGWDQKQLDEIFGEIQAVQDDIVHYSPYGDPARGLKPRSGTERIVEFEPSLGRPGAQAARRIPQTVVRGTDWETGLPVAEHLRGDGVYIHSQPLVGSQLPPGASSIEGTYKHTASYRNPVRTRDADIPGHGGGWNPAKFEDRFDEVRNYHDRGVNRRQLVEGELYTPESIRAERAEYDRMFRDGESVVPVISYRAWEIIKETWKLHGIARDEIFLHLPQYRDIVWKNKYWVRQPSRAYMRKMEDGKVAADPGTTHLPETASFEHAKRHDELLGPGDLAVGTKGAGERQGLEGGIWNMFRSKREAGWIDKQKKYHYSRIRAQHTEEGFARIRPRMKRAQENGDIGGAAALGQMMAVLGGKGHKTWVMESQVLASVLDTMPAVMRTVRGTYKLIQGDKYKFTPTDKMMVKWTTTVASGLYRGLLFGRLPTAIAQFGQFINNMAEFGALNTASGIAALAREAARAPGRKAAAETLFGGGERGIYGVLPSWIGMGAGYAVGSMFFGPVGIAVAAAMVPASRAIKQAVRAGLPEEAAMRIGIDSSSQLVRGKEFTKSTFRLMQMLDETGFSLLDMAETVLRGATFMTALDVSYRQGFRHMAAVERAIRGVDLTQFTYDQLSRNPFWRHSMVGTVMAPLSSYPLKQFAFVRRMLVEDASDGAPAGVAMMRYLFFNGLIAGALREGSEAAFGEELVLRDLQGRIEPAIFTDMLGGTGGVKAPEGFATIMSFAPGRTPGPQVTKTFFEWIRGDVDRAEWLNLFIKSFVPFGLVVSDLYRFDSRMEEESIRREEGFWTQATKQGSLGGLVRYTTPVREYGRLFGFVSPKESDEMDQERRAKDFADSYAETRLIRDFEGIVRNSQSPEERNRLLAELADTDEGRRKIAMGGIRASELRRYGYSRLRRVFVGLPSPMKRAIVAGSRGSPEARAAALSMGMTKLEWDAWQQVLRRLMREEFTRGVPSQVGRRRIR